MQSATSIDTAEFKNLAEQAALKAGELLRRKWNEPRQIDSKGYRDVVTDADYASQEIITELIRAKFPDHGFLTEEDDPSLPQAGPVIWVIDPVDGTTNYSRQIPTYCISISAAAQQASSENSEHYYVPVAGVIYDPMRDELFSAETGSRSTLNGHVISVSEVDDVGEAVICMDWSRDFEKRQAMLFAINRFAQQARTIRATGSASLSLAWVAAGRIDVYFNYGVGPWDVAAAAVIIAQAGGKVTNPAGKTWSLADPGCVASNEVIHLSFMTQAGIRALT
ncbi:MAG TPA: inositol monophosphatase family protein [Anaerolineae bacterium]|jgi:myo-inositol-1(or 4)-monophosphatase|nr:inositol monophosphatase family protein [Anaerolineae bacterium]